MKHTLMTLGLLLAALSMSAQRADKLPIDKDVRVGHLDNGLTYYIRHNEQPKERAEFHIAQAVGAVLEEDNQNGLAHFLEHMAFNGTKHFAGKGIINYFESIGVNFGGNINAYTSIDETVYRLSDVPTVREGIIDSALLVMYDWSCGLLLEPDEIDAERGVIREEWRTRATPGRLLYKDIVAKKYPGTQYGKRDVIGDTAVINNFAYDALRDYYHKWYGPDLQAIIVVGDIDVDKIEQKIKDLWKDVPARANRGERPLYTVPFNDRARVVTASNKEAQSTDINIEWLHEQMQSSLRNTPYEYRRNICLSLICSMMNNRFSDITEDPNASFKSAGVGYGEIVKLKDAFLASVSPKEGRETEALNDLLYQLEKMQRYGFKQSELERVKTNYLNSMENSLKSKNTRSNRSYVNEYVRNFEDQESIPGIDWEVRFAQEQIPTITLTELNMMVRTLMHNHPTVSITGQEKEGIHIPTEEEVLAMMQAVQKAEIESPEDLVYRTQLIKKAPKAGKIKSTSSDERYGTTEWTLSNGIRVIFRPSKFDENSISLQAYSMGGSSLVKTEDLPSLRLTTSLIYEMGLSDFSRRELNKAMTGKSAGASLSIDTYSESVWGSSSIKDFETMLQLVYLNFTAPRRDEKAYETYMNRQKEGLRNRNKNHKTVFGDSLALTQSCHSERTLIFDMDALEKVSLDKVMEIYHDRFDNPGDFTFIIYGDINPADKNVQKAVCQWIGGLKTKKAAPEQWRDWNIHAPKGIVKNHFTREMEIRQTTNRIQYTSDEIPYSLENAVTMELIGRILSTRYLESIREREGGSYGVGCGGWVTRIPYASARLVMQFDTDPEKEERLMQVIHEEVQTIVKDGPLAQDLQKEKESMLKDYKENLQTNWWWRSAVYDRLVYGDDLLADYEKTVQGITAEKIQALLTKLVAAGNVFEVVMSPAPEVK